MTRNWLIVTPSFPGAADSAPETVTEGREQDEYKPDSTADAPGNADYDDSDSQQPVAVPEESGVFPESPDPADTSDAAGGPADSGDGGAVSTEENQPEEGTGPEEADTGNGPGDRDTSTDKAETEPGTIPEPETQPETETEPESGAEPEPVTEPEPESQTDTEPESESESQTDTELESESQTDTELESELETESEPESELETESEPQSQTEPEFSPKPGSDSIKLFPEYGQLKDIFLSDPVESDSQELYTEVMILHEDLQQIHEDLQVTCSFIIIFLVIIVCHYIYKFFNIFF